jgi:aspartate aminotransferase-like enzyme/predicted N-acetyltransferase YhbS
MPPLVFKIAESDDEFAQIHRLNHQTFAAEIPQHAPQSNGILRDKFHDENLYFIAVRGADVVGMMALRDRRPFSLDAKVPNLNALLPPHGFACEVRLLAVAPSERQGRVFRGLLRQAVEYSAARGYDLALISGTTRQQKLYRHLGFQAFGPLVGNSSAQFQPMFLTWPALQKALGKPINLLPGPTDLRPAVSAALHNSVVLHNAALSHRAPAFHRLLNETRALLSQLTRAPHIEIALGSGTLANDTIAAQLRPLGPGLLLSNGEFGERLSDHARRSGLDFQTHRVDWGEVFNWSTVREKLHGKNWLWAVHCETSCGTLNDLERLKSLAAQSGARLCLDCVSSLGALPLDLSGVHLASGSSGKALGALPGLALVFASDFAPPRDDVPRALDLGLYSREAHVPFTHSAPLVAALRAALDYQSSDFWTRLAQSGACLRTALQNDGWHFVAQKSPAPHVLTLALPPQHNARELGEFLEERGYLAGFRSSYLQKRNWLQFCLMSEPNGAALEKLPHLLRRYGA